MTDNAMVVSRCNLVLLAGHVRPDFRMTMRKDGKRMTFDHTRRHGCEERQAVADCVQELQRAHRCLLEATRQGMPEDVCNEARIRKRAAAAVVAQTCLPLMRDVAAGWLQSTLGQVVVATSTFDEDDQLSRLAYSVYLEIQESLETLPIDPEKDVCALIRAITRAALYEQNNVINHQPKKPARQPTTIITLLEEHSSASFDEQTIETLAHQQISHSIQAALTDSRYADIDRRILSLRYKYELPYDEIAATLGPGYTATSVRQRYHRFIQRLRSALCPYGTSCAAPQSCDYCMR
jgi:hypothetical protein